VKTDKQIVEKRSLSSLQPHPQQAALFPPLSDLELKALANDIERNGLQQPVEILPDGTIICGHQRVAAAKLLGWAEIDCNIRTDLAEAGDEAVEQRLIEDNLHRRQLDELGVARIYRHLKQQRPGKRAGNGAGNLRDELAKRFDGSGRTLDRWAKVLNADPAVQEAVSQRRLTLSEANRIAVLPAKEQRKIVAGLAKGRKLTDLLPSPAGGRTGRSSASTFERLLPQLQQMTGQFEQLELPAASQPAERNVILRGIGVLRDLHQQLKDQAEHGRVAQQANPR